MTTTQITTRTPGELFAGSLLRWHATAESTAGACALAEAHVVPGAEPPLHVHEREDETYHVLEGEVTFKRGDELIEARPGDVVHLPRGLEHGFAVRTAHARLLFLCTPGGLEDAFRALSEPADGLETPPPAAPPGPQAVTALVAAFAGYGVTFTGPPLSALLG